MVEFSGMIVLYVNPHLLRKLLSVKGLIYFFQRFIFRLNKTPCHVIVINTKGTTAHKVG